MQNKKIINFSKIALIIAYSVATSIVILIYDNFEVKKSTMWNLGELYSTINITLWTIQATLSTLMIAFASFFVGKLENTYYGISVKEILVFDNSNILKLNFFEHIVVGILLNAVSFIPVCCNSMWGVVAIFIAEMYIIIHIVKTSFNIALDEKTIRILTKQRLTYIIKEVIVELEKDVTKEYCYQLRKIFNIMIKQLHNDIIVSSELHNNDEFRFLSDSMHIDDDIKTDNKYILDMKLEYLTYFFEESINYKKYDIAFEVAQTIIYKNTQNSKNINIVAQLFDEYRNHNIEKNKYYDFIEEIIDAFTRPNKDFDIITYLASSTIKYYDNQLFNLLTRRISQYGRCYYIYSHIVLSYLYYLKLEDEKYFEYYYTITPTKLKKFIEDDISEVNECINIVKNSDSIQGLFNLFELLKDVNFIIDLELQPIGYMGRFSIIQGYMKNYAIFYLYIYYESQYKYIFDKFSLEDLINIRDYFTNDGRLDKMKDDHYNIFLELTNSEDMKKDNNLELVNDLDNEIDNKKYNTDNNQNKGETNGKDENANPRPNK